MEISGEKRDLCRRKSQGASMKPEKSAKQANVIKTGILGGTFDPIHLGHLLIAESAYDLYGLDKVLIMPSGHSYFKDNLEKKVTDARTRLEMARAAVSENPHFELSDMETNRPGNSYTSETIRALKKEHPNTQYYYIIGGDTVMALKTWRDPEVIFENTIILAAMRADQVPGPEMEAEMDRLTRICSADIRLLPVPSIGISSTDIRNRVEHGHSIHYMVPDAVERFIMEKGLYT